MVSTGNDNKGMKLTKCQYIAENNVPAALKPATRIQIKATGRPCEF